MMLTTRQTYANASTSPIVRTLLAGLGQDSSLVSEPPGTPVDTSAAPSPSVDAGVIGSIVTGVNSEIGWLNNLVRANQGKAPLPSSVAQPGVSVSLAPDTQRMLMIGGIALLAVFAFKKLRR